jgi:NAD(P)-dependent dehydrogenase (short-subunit alcohol dehydrogenase family)
MPQGWLEGKSAIVTGAGRGIGRAVALGMAKEGAKVVVVDPGVALDGSGGENGPAEEVVAEIKAAGGTAVPSLEFVGTMEAGERIINTALENFGRVDIVVNVAGILRDRMVFNMSFEEWDAVIKTHLKGHFSLVKPASILMRQQRWGRIINFTSPTGLVGNAGQANYGAAKGGISGLTRVLARDLGRYGVTTNAISPAAATRMTQSVPQAARDLRARAGMAGGPPGGAPAAGGPPGGAPRPPTAGAPAGAPPQGQGGGGFSSGSPEAIAPMAVFLASDFAWNVNGQIFSVAGGTVSVNHHPLAGRTIIKQGMWTFDELDKMVPSVLLAGSTNPAPPPPDLEVPGRPAAEPAAAAPQA